MMLKNVVFYILNENSATFFFSSLTSPLTRSALSASNQCPERCPGSARRSESRVERDSKQGGALWGRQLKFIDDSYSFLMWSSNCLFLMLDLSRRRGAMDGINRWRYRYYFDIPHREPRCLSFTVSLSVASVSALWITAVVVVITALANGDGPGCCTLVGENRCWWSAVSGPVWWISSSFTVNKSARCMPRGKEENRPRKGTLYLLSWTPCK